MQAGVMELCTRKESAQPYQFVGPLEIAPALAGPTYSLITHWSSADELAAWQRSALYQGLQALGSVASETFVALPEPGVRDYLREDKLQRQWMLEGHPSA